MSINIKDKIAIVTGASRGTGEGIAKIFNFSFNFQSMNFLC